MDRQPTAALLGGSDCPAPAQSLRSPVVAVRLRQAKSLRASKVSVAIHSIVVCVFAEDFLAPPWRGLLCFARHIKMYFRIHFRIHIHQHFQSSFSTLRFLLNKQHFPFGTGFAHSCMSRKLPDKTTKTSTKETYHVLPNTPHRHRHHRLLHHPKNPRHLTLNKGESP